MTGVQSRRDMAIRMLLETDELSRGFKKAEESAKVFERELAKIEAKQAKAQHDQAANIAHVTKLRAKHERDAALEAERAARQRAQAMDKVGKASLAMGAAVGAGVLLAANAAMKWESAWAGVEKTVDGSHEQMQILESDLRELARTLPTTHTEIAAVAEAAGQLGIQRGAIAGFTKTMIDLGETTNLTADEAATAMAQIANIMGTSADDVDRMGAALVALGNNGASTEADIVQMALRIAGAGKQVGLAESEVFAMANTLASLGINAEAGGSAISRFMMDLAVSVETGGGELERFADVAGMTVGDFTTLFRDDAAGAVGAFTDGLGRIKESGGSAIATLEEMEITEIRLRDTLLRLAGGQGLMNASLRQGREAWQDNTALVDEANKRYATTEAKMQIAKNAVNDLAIDLGTTLLPALASVVSGVTSFASFISDLPGPLKAAASVLAVVTSGILLVGGTALIAVPKITALKVSLDALAASAPRAAAGLGMVARAAGVVGIFAAAAAAGYALGKVLESVFEDSAPAVDELTVSLLDFANKGKISGEAASWLGEDFQRLGKQIATANANKLDIFDGRGAMEINSARDILSKLDDTLATMVQNGHADEAAALLEKMRAAAVAQGHDVAELDKHMDDYQATVTATAAEQDTAAGSAYALATGLSGVDANAVNAYASLGEYAASLNMTEDDTKALIKQTEAWADSLADFVQPLGAYTDLLGEKEAAERKSAEAQAESTESQKDSWEDYADAVAVSVSEYLGELQKQVDAQEQHADNMRLLAGRVTEGTLDELARMGPEGAPLVAELVNASDEELDKLDDLFGRRTKEATGAMAGELYLANVLLPKLASKLGDDTAFALARSLANGTTTVGQIAQDYAWALEGGLAPLLKSLGAPMVHSLIRQENAQARRPRGYANGGIEDHTAQIAPAGAWRVWAEDETGGEAYIPLAPSKRGRSVSIWEETGRRLGVFADGGFHRPGDVPRPPSTRPFGHPISTAADATMAKAYGEAVEFVKANAAPALSAGIGFQAMMAALHTRFPGLPLISGLRPGAITATGNKSLHGAGRAVDIPPRMDVFDWIAQHYGAKSAELIFSPAGGRQLHRGKPHVYGEPTRSMHYDHVHWAMAKGGILNPHVRDAGGPLLPGYTLNATGGPEMVLPMANGGFTGTSLSGDAAAVIAAGGTAADLSALLEQWDRHLDQLAQAKKRGELVLEVQKKQAGAMEALRDFDVAAAADAEREQVQAAIDLLETQEKAREDAARAAEEDYQRRVDINNNLFELGLLSTADHLGNLERRMAKEEQYSDAWMALHRQREQVLKDVADAEREVLERSQDALDKAAGHLNTLLDEQQRIRDRQAASVAAHTRDLEKIQTRQAETEAAFFKSTAAAAAAYANEQVAIAARQQQMLDQRRDTLLGWADLSQQVERKWGNSAAQLIDNAKSQAEQFSSWMQALADARGRGLSEEVIGALGLDDGPQALAQLQQLNSATEAEIADLNAAVLARTEQAGEQVRREQAMGFASMTEEYAAAQQAYADEIAALQERYRTDQEKLAAELKEMQDQFVKDQQALADELAAVGREQGRSYGAAIAEGLRSEVPAVQAAAAELEAAMKGLQTARDALAAEQAKPSPAKPSSPGGLTANQRAAIAAGVPYGGFVGRYSDPIITSRSTSSAVTVNLNAPVYGVNDLKKAITEAVHGQVAGQHLDVQVAGKRG